MFLQDNPIGPGDRVLAGLSVAFDASCEEMWLAWRHGACLVPAPRSLVRSGMDLGPWLVARDITVVSTVPTLAALWPAEALEAVRLLIFGGEACPPELAERLAAGPEGPRGVEHLRADRGHGGRVRGACSTATGPVSIGLPLPGWDLAVVDKDGAPVGVGEVGELVIGGVGLARYLDPEKDAEKYAPMPTLGWDRAYRSGDLVRLEPDGLIFLRARRRPGQGRRPADRTGRGGRCAGEPARGRAAAPRRCAAPRAALRCWSATSPAPTRRSTWPRRATSCAESLPAALVPRLVLRRRVAHPHVGQGRPRRAALAAARRIRARTAPDLGGTMGWLAGLWRDVLAAPVDGPEADFFALGGGSLSAAQLVAALRQRYPQVTVADLYDHPRLGSLAGFLDELDPPPAVETRVVQPTPLLSQAFQVAMSLPLATLTGLQWVVWLALINNVVAALRPVPWLAPSTGGGSSAGSSSSSLRSGGWASRCCARECCVGSLEPGTYRRGGAVHLRVWLAERLADASGAENLAGAPWMLYYARALGDKVGKGVDLHSLPPVTGMLTLGSRSSIEPEVDLSGQWIDGDRSTSEPSRSAPTRRSARAPR